MPLRIVVENGRERPAFVCDECGETIVENKDVNFAWCNSDQVGESFPVLIVHYRCFDALQARKGSVLAHLDLDVLLWKLVSDLKADVSKRGFQATESGW